MLISKRLLGYLDGEFIFLNNERFLVEVDGESIFLISIISGIKNIESFSEEEFEFNLDPATINNFLNSWFSKNQLLKIIPKVLEQRDYDKFWLTEKLYLDQERLIRESEKRSAIVKLTGRTGSRDQNITSYFTGKRNSYIISIFSVYKFDIPSKEEVEMFENYENR